MLAPHMSDQGMPLAHILIFTGNAVSPPSLSWLTWRKHRIWMPHIERAPKVCGTRFGNRLANVQPDVSSRWTILTPQVEDLGKDLHLICVLGWGESHCVLCCSTKVGDWGIVSVEGMIALSVSQYAMCTFNKDCPKRVRIVAEDLLELRVSQCSRCTFSDIRHGSDAHMAHTIHTRIVFVSVAARIEEALKKISSLPFGMLLWEWFRWRTLLMYP